MKAVKSKWWKIIREDRKLHVGNDDVFEKNVRLFSLWIHVSKYVCKFQEYYCIALFWFCLFTFWHQNSGNHLKKYYNSCVIPYCSLFCFIIPTPSWPSKLNSDWFFCRLRQWGVWRITWQILSSFLTVFLSDWAWLISQRIQQEKYKCVCNSRVLQSIKE